ncbi:MAG: NAD(P)/FAD-dependent oxidoreductase [Clostridium sp.]|nr:NAD(P)/FAD-dependent oxidoreductase [Clostridium sp.]
MKKVIVIGAGPAGMMAAITAAKDGNEVILLESNEKVGKKLFITGKGRCNVTNSKDISEFFDFIPGNPHFLYSALYSYTNEDTINFFESQGIRLKSERGGRVFPSSDKSSDIIKGLLKELNNNKVDIRLNSKVTDIIYKNSLIDGVKVNNNYILVADNYIIATGGVSYPLTGSTGDGLKFSKKVGHNITNLKGSLVPIEINNSWISEIMGLTLRNIGISLYEVDKKKPIYKEQGEVLFTSYGISGPLALKASRYINEGLKYYITLDLKPALTLDELDLRVQKDFKKYINKEFKNSLDDLFPKKLIPIIISLSNINANKKVNEITKEERRSLVNLIKGIKLTIRKLRPIEEAIVTSGGVDTLEIDPSTMKSKLVNNLSFAGEVIDIDAYTGGYNVQIALSTGYLAGSNI